MINAGEVNQQLKGNLLNGICKIDIMSCGITKKKLESEGEEVYYE